MAGSHELGKRGEELAAQYFRDKGYKILETNWRFGHNELDLIAKDGNTLVVAEVKTRHSNALGEPEMAVTRDKQRAIIRSANAFVRFRRLNMEVRFDIVSILITGDQVQINHIPDAFYAIVK
ncbi:MAG: YraN family protein [bacterium]